MKSAQIGLISKLVSAPAGGMSGSQIIFVTQKLSERSLSVLDVAISGRWWRSAGVRRSAASDRVTI